MFPFDADSDYYICQQWRRLWVLLKYATGDFNYVSCVGTLKSVVPDLQNVWYIFCSNVWKTTL